MSSATSIDQQVPLKPESKPPRSKPDPTGSNRPASKSTSDDQGIRPWHFFVLLSLVAATVAVVLSRRATPEHLILMSLTIAAAGVAGAAFYRMLAPLVAKDVSMFSEPLTERARAVLEREKALALRSIKELEFDRAMGKLSEKDFDEMSGRLRSRAVSLMQQLDESSSYRTAIERDLRERLAARVGRKPDAPEGQPPADSTCACGTMNDEDALFCKRCGTKLTGPSAADDIGRSR